MDGKMKFKYRTILHAQPFWNTSNKIWMHTKGIDIALANMSESDKLLT